MQNDLVASIAALSDCQLLSQVKLLVARERGVTAELIAYLAELDTREVHVREGYRSLYIYCRDALHLSDWEAFNRIEVARTARRFPAILDLLANGSVNLTTVKLLSAHLTESNHRAVLDAARHKRKAEVEELVARLSPQPDVPASVRRVPPRTAGSRSLPGRGGARPLEIGQHEDEQKADEEKGGLFAVGGPSSETFIREAERPRPAPAVAKPLSPDRYKYQVTIGGETLEKIRLAKDMLGHAVPSGDDAAILDRAFTALLAQLAKDRFGEVRKPRTPPRAEYAVAGPAAGAPASSTGRDVMRKRSPRVPSAAVKRAVWMRDLGRCAFIGVAGHRCNERRFVEFHHVDPYALGGEATVEGTALRCRRHNDYEGRLYFGDRRGHHGGDGEVATNAGVDPPN